MDFKDFKLEGTNEGKEEFFKEIYFESEYNVKFQMKSDFVGDPGHV